MKLKLKKYISLILIIAMFLFAVISMTANVSAQDTDSDNDGWTDAKEIEEGTNITDPDTDDDGIIDSEDDRPLKEDKFNQYSKDGWDKKKASDSLMNIFLFVLLLSFAIFSLFAGIFTAYFGAGKSRAIGGGLLVLGLIVILIWVYFGLIKNFPDDSLIGIIHWEAARTLEAVITVLGAIIGAVVAIVLFLVAIMKS
jgi:hypothetical protein